MSFQTKFVPILLVLFIYCSSFDLTFAKPNWNAAQNGNITESSGTDLVRNKRVFQCSTGGCFNGYCWAYCEGFGIPGTREWCYTTKSYSQSYEYVGCSQDSECDACWKCAGSCTV